MIDIKDIQIEDRLTETLLHKDIDICGTCKYFKRKNDPLDFTKSAGDCSKHNLFVFSFNYCKNYEENLIKPLGYLTKKLMDKNTYILPEWFTDEQIECVESKEVFASAEQVCNICKIKSSEMILHLLSQYVYDETPFDKVNGLTFKFVKNGIFSNLEFYEKLKVEDNICSDCGALKSEYHKDGCDIEKCPKCGHQLISCDCYMGNK